MTKSLTSVIRIFGSLCVLGGYSHWLSAQAPMVESERCEAEPVPAYFAPLAATNAQTSELCFTRWAEVGDIDRFVVVDVSAQPQSRYLPHNAIHLPDWQVKTKSFLKEKPVLIVAEPYRRHSLAKLCKQLIQSGFQNPKVLIDNRTEKGETRFGTAIPVEEFLVEVSNFGAAIIAADQDTADELEGLGLSAIVAGSRLDLKATVRDVTINYSLNGYLPVFVVGNRQNESELKALLESEPVSEAFLVSGGIEKIKTALKSSALSTARRRGPEISCAG